MTIGESQVEAAMPGLCGGAVIVEPGPTLREHQGLAIEAERRVWSRRVDQDASTERIRDAPDQQLLLGVEPQRQGDPRATNGPDIRRAVVDDRRVCLRGEDARRGFDAERYRPSEEHRALEARLFARPAVPPVVDRVVPEWTQLHQELKKPGVTLSLLWVEYRAQHPSGYAYSQVCERYRQWARALKPSMRQVHRAGTNKRRARVLDGRRRVVRRTRW